MHLYEILLAQGTDATGIIRFNKEGLSEEAKEKKLKKGETITRFNNKVMHMKRRDKKYVKMLSTSYDDSMETVQPGQKRVRKPSVCIKCKKMHMRGIDLMDQITTALSITCKGIKKYYKIFPRFMEMTLHNCYVIYERNGSQKKNC